MVIPNLLYLNIYSEIMNSEIVADGFRPECGSFENKPLLLQILTFEVFKPTVAPRFSGLKRLYPCPLLAPPMPYESAPQAIPSAGAS